MNAVLDADTEFFAPSITDRLDPLFAQHKLAQCQIQNVAEFMESERASPVFGYFTDACSDRLPGLVPAVSEFFNAEKATKALDAEYWQRVLNMTDVLDVMPAQRRREWNQLIADHKAPSFDESTVRNTLDSLLVQRMEFFSDMVDGVFRGLSDTHITNRPEGFSKRMIIKEAVSPFLSMPASQGEYIHDLRVVVAKLMKRDLPQRHDLHRIFDLVCRDLREWVVIDGGAIALRAYGNGNMHCEIHPDMAWRLNEVLAVKHPHAIPAMHRRRPAKTVKTGWDKPLMDNLIPFTVLRALADGRIDRHDSCLFKINTLNIEKHFRRELNWVLSGLGGLRTASGDYRFEYPPRRVIESVVLTGSMPGKTSYQFYPTPDDLAQQVADIANVQLGERVLEPSAGIGSLAGALPYSEQICCIEISAIHKAVLQERGFFVICEDFLGIEKKDVGGLFDVVCMNPPFSDGRGEKHLRHALTLLRPGGRLVAILPDSARRWDIESMGAEVMEWQGPFDNRFPGTSVSVSILVAMRR